MKRRPRFKRIGKYDSKQEQGLHANYPQLNIKPSTLTYTREYHPDFYLGRTTEGLHVYLELKEWLPLGECTKLLAVVNGNPNIILCVLAKSLQLSAYDRLANHTRIHVHQGYTTLPAEWLRLANVCCTT